MVKAYPVPATQTLIVEAKDIESVALMSLDGKIIAESVANAANNADGDSLVYGFCTPFAGASSSDPQPNPPDGVVLSIIWPEDFYPNNALGPSNYLNMGANGHCTGMSSNLGRYAIAICAMDFRNGIQLTSTILEVPLTIIDCTTDIDEIDNTTHPSA
ncbi:unnamed protein product [Rotaria sordida]|uniref:Uncharacterized protein n=1 Tax=Rotaria sordida TaxID=392033 RepID=A0A813U2D7_9BILA|nr:unnamed protein product [Rotaria sordida]